jgi:hypothetical protein
MFHLLRVLLQLVGVVLLAQCARLTLVRWLDHCLVMMITVPLEAVLILLSRLPFC